MVSGLILAGAGLGGLWLARQRETMPGADVADPSQDSEPLPVILTRPAHPPGEPEGSNLLAFLEILRVGESSDNYRALSGGGFFSDFSAHPGLRGWPGVTTNGTLSTAAGAYQINLPTYRDFGGGPFDPESQDGLAVRIIMARGDYSAVLAGDVETAAYSLRKTWEIFQRSRWQGSLLVSAFENFGGFTA